MARSGRRAGLAAGVALGVLGCWASADPAGAASHAVPEVQVVVALDHVHALRAASTLAGLPGPTPAALVADRYTLTVPAGEVAATLTRLRAEPGVRYATPTRRLHALDVNPGDPCYSSSCGPVAPTVIDGDTGYSTTGGPESDLPLIGAPRAWSATAGDPVTSVAVLDTGVDANHEDLVGRAVAGPVVLSAPDPSCTATLPPGDTDDNGHGTHVSGTVAAANGNGTGVASLGGYSVHVETWKVLDCAGGGSSSDLASAIYQATDAGFPVISMSLGNDACGVPTPGGPNTDCGPDPDTQAAVEYALAHGVVVVAAAGNDGQYGEPYASEPTYPASYPGVLSVAATDDGGTIAGFSQHGSVADIAAPGVRITSTWSSLGNATYAVLSGTSMATPHVAAAAALVKGAAPGLTGAQITSDLESTASPVHGSPIAGGLLDVPAALQAARSGAPYQGYRLVGSDGSAYAFGASPFLGDLAGTRLNRPVVGTAPAPGQTGYWMVASDGGIFAFGSAGFHGSTGGMRLNQPIVGMAPTPSGQGYWLVAADGGIFAFGDAGFYGSTGSMHLNKPVVGMAATPSGKGYWLVASDGGIFAFGPPFYGSTGSMALARPIVGVDASSDGGGYRLIASDGGVFSYGDAAFDGSTGGAQIPAPIVGAG